MNFIFAAKLLLITYFGQMSTATPESRSVSIINRDSNRQPTNEHLYQLSRELPLSPFDCANREEKHAPTRQSSDRSLIATGSSAVIVETFGNDETEIRVNKIQQINNGRLKDHHHVKLNDPVRDTVDFEMRQQHRHSNRVKRSDEELIGNKPMSLRHLHDTAQRSLSPSLFRNNKRKVQAGPTKSSDLISYQDSINSDTQRVKLGFNPARINELRGVFDDKLPLNEENFRRIPPHQIAFILPKIVYDTRILPAPFGSKDHDSFHSVFLSRQRPPLRTPQSVDGKDDDKRRINESRRDEIPVSEKTIEDIPSSFTTSVPPLKNFRFLATQPFANLPSHKYVSKDRPLNHADPNVINNLQMMHRPYVFDETYEHIPEDDNFVNREGYEYDPPGSGGDDEVQFSYSPYTRQQNSRGNENVYSRYAGKYTFGYRVTDHESGNDFGHEERRDGKFTNGRYHVLLPDGRVQNVNYHVDETGYHARVSYKPERRHYEAASNDIH